MRQTLLQRGPEWRRRILIVMIVGVPVLFLRNLSDPINVPKLALLSLGVSVVAALRAAELAQGIERPELRDLWIPAAAIAGPLTLGWAFSPYRSWSWLGHYPRYLGLLPYLLVIAFGFLVADAFRNRSQQVAWALAAAGAATGFYAVVQQLGLDPFEWTARGEVTDQVVSTLGNSNFVGGFLGIILPVALSLWFTRADRRWVSVAIALTFLGWLVATSQAGWAGGAAGVVVSAGVLLAARFRWMKLVAGVASVLIAAAVVGAVLVGIFFEEQAPPTVQRRAEWWVAASRMAADAPVTGRGPDAFALDHGVHRTLDDVLQAATTLESHPHSLFLWLATSAGVAGAVGFLVLVVWVARAYRQATADPMLAGFLGAMVAYLVQSLASIDTLSLRVAFWGAAAGYVATLVPEAVTNRSATKGRKRGPSKEPLRGLPVVGAAVLGVFLGVWFAARLVAADAAFASARASIAEGSFSATEAQFERTVGRRSEPAYRAAFASYLGSVAAGAAAQDEALGAQLVARTLDQYDYLDGVPDPRALTDLARVSVSWEEAGLTTESRVLQNFQRALERDPHNFYLFAEAGNLALSYESFSEAVDFFTGQTRTAPTDPGGWFGLARARAGVEDAEGAIRALERAAELDPALGSSVEAQTLLEEVRAAE
jgi:O-antigen ligase